jgi:hypothetical protein
MSEDTMKWFQAVTVDPFKNDGGAIEHMWGYRKGMFFGKGENVIVTKMVFGGDCGLRVVVSDGQERGRLCKMTVEEARKHLRLVKPYKLENERGQKVYDRWLWEMNT